MDEVSGAAEFDDKAAELDDEQLRKAAKLLNLDDLADSADIPQFLAIAREAAERATGLRPFDVQLQGALRMLAGDVVEMATGEGKTLAGAIAAAGYALGGRHVHVISVNDYLARRDAEWMGPLLEAMGLTVGWITAELDRDRAPRGLRVRRHLRVGQRDRLRRAARPTGHRRRRPGVAEPGRRPHRRGRLGARRRGAGAAGAGRHHAPRDAAAGDHRAGRRADRRARTTTPTPTAATSTSPRRARRRSRSALGGIDLYSEEHVGTTLTEVNVALHAHVLLQRDVHYIVRDGAVHLINASRGRIAQLQRWPDGLQAAVEAKEGIETTETGEVLDTITVQALINRYPTVCGMTGTALAAGEQLRQFYKLGVSPIPPNTPNIREDEADRVYITAAAKNDAIVEHIAEVHETGRRCWSAPTTSPNPRNCTSGCCKPRRPGRRAQRQERRRGGRASSPRPARSNAVTVSTQMAGRGTDIRLGGSDEAEPRRGRRARRPARGRHRHGTTPSGWTTSCAGRAGRQGDPGSSVFFSSWEDDVVVVAPRSGQAAHRDRRGRPDRQPQGRRPARPRPAGGRGPAARRARQHLALQPADRPAARDHRRAPQHAAAHRRPRARNSKDLSPKRYEELSEDALRGAAGADLPTDHAVSPRPRLGRSPGVPRRHPGEHPPAGAGPAEPPRRVPPAGRRRVRAPWRPTRSRRRSRRSRPPNCASRTSRAWTCRSWPGRRRRGRTWCTTTRCGRHAVGAEPARGFPLGADAEHRTGRRTGLRLGTRRAAGTARPGADGAQRAVSVLRLILIGGLRLPAAGRARRRLGRPRS